eukprot:Gb_34341 [translate_table: standard]
MLGGNMTKGKGIDLEAEAGLLKVTKARFIVDVLPLSKKTRQFPPSLKLSLPIGVGEGLPLTNNNRTGEISPYRRVYILDEEITQKSTNQFPVLRAVQHSHLRIKILSCIQFFQTVKTQETQDLEVEENSEAHEAEQT